MKIRKLVAAALLVASFAFGSQLHADAVAISNHSFENGTGAPAPGSWNNNTPEDWTATGSIGMQSDNPNPAGIDGNVFAFLQGGATGDLTGGTLVQDISIATGGVSAGDFFTLTLAATNQNASPSFDFDIRDNADPLAGVSLLGGTQQSPGISGAVWDDYDVTGTVTTASSNVFLVINTNGPQVRVDNVRLDLVAAVPEPTSLGVLAIGLLAVASRRRRN